MWPKVYGQPDIGLAVYVISEPFIYCYNSLRSSGKAFHQMLEPGCRDQFPFRGDKAWLAFCSPAHPKGVWEFFTDLASCMGELSC